MSPGIPDRKRLATTFASAARAANFVLKVLPVPDRPVELLTRPPRVTSIVYESHYGPTQATLHSPAGPGPHPAVVVSLGAVPFDVDHPQVPRLAAALARSGFVTLMHWSPAMRDLRLDSLDAADIARAFEALTDQPHVDASRSGLIGTCVGGGFALLAASDERIRDRTSFVAALAPYSSMWTFLPDIASATTWDGHRRVPWDVDSMTRKVFARTLTTPLEEAEQERLRAAYLEGGPHPVRDSLSPEGHAIRDVLLAASAEDALHALRSLPAESQAEIDALSPLSHLDAVRAPLLAIAHDRTDGVIPIAESRRLRAALRGRPGVQYTEFTMFEHLDPAAATGLTPPRLALELAKFFALNYAVFRHVASPPGSSSPG